MTSRAVREGFFDLAVSDQLGPMAIDVGRHADPALALAALRAKAQSMRDQATRLAQAGQQRLAASVTAQAACVDRNADALEVRTRATEAIEQAQVAANRCDTALLALGGVLVIHQDAPGALRSICGDRHDEAGTVPVDSIRKRLDRDIAQVEEFALALLEIDQRAAAKVARTADALSRRAAALMSVVEGHVRIGKISGEPEPARVLLLALAHTFIAADEHREQVAAGAATRAIEAAKVRAELDAGEVVGEPAHGSHRTRGTRSKQVSDKPAGTLKPNARREQSACVISRPVVRTLDQLRAHIVRAGTNGVTP